MIEEAAGTKMFEAKKQNAVRTIDKKQGKVEEIEQVNFIHMDYKSWLTGLILILFSRCKGRLCLSRFSPFLFILVYFSGIS